VNKEKALESLQRAANRRANAEEERRFATAELHKYAIAAKAAGVGVTEIAAAAGLSRQAVYEILGQQPSAQD
jgi:DNA invertase Pin-like site-specific DNA recombinase